MKPAPENCAELATGEAATAEPDNPSVCQQRGYAALFSQHNEALVGFLYRRLGNKHEAMDVAQEAYVRILGLGEVKVINHLRAYLFRTAANIAMDRLRQKARRSSEVPEHLVAAELHSSSTGPDRRALGKQQLERLRVAISRLAPKCRYAFLRFRIDGESYSNISSEMGLSESMVRKYVLAALRQCKAYVEDGVAE